MKWIIDIFLQLIHAVKKSMLLINKQNSRCMYIFNCINDIKHKKISVEKEWNNQKELIHTCTKTITYANVSMDQTENGFINSFQLRVGTNDTNFDIVNSSEYSQKFTRLTYNTKVNEAIRKYAKASLKHRSGTDKEDLYIIDSLTGNILIRKTNAKTDLGVSLTKKEYIEVVRHNGGMIGLHNHPTNILPTGSDFVTAADRKYDFGIVVTHEGKVYKYTGGRTPFRAEYFDKCVEKRLRELYNFDVIAAQKRTIEEFGKEYGITCEEL